MMRRLGCNAAYLLTRPAILPQNEQAPNTVGDYDPRLAATDVSWSKHIGRGYLLVSVFACGLGRVEWVGEDRESAALAAKEEAKEEENDEEEDEDDDDANE